MRKISSNKSRFKWQPWPAMGSADDSSVRQISRRPWLWLFITLSLHTYIILSKHPYPEIDHRAQSSVYFCMCLCSILCSWVLILMWICERFVLFILEQNEPAKMNWQRHFRKTFAKVQSWDEYSFFLSVTFGSFLLWQIKLTFHCSVGHKWFINALWIVSISCFKMPIAIFGKDNFGITSKWYRLTQLNDPKSS